MPPAGASFHSRRTRAMLPKDSVERPIQQAPRTGACHPCRARKVKCDGQEVCSRCLKYDIDCLYDELPNRRGPDRVPRRRRRSKLQIQAQEQRDRNLDSPPSSGSPPSPSTTFPSSHPALTDPYPSTSSNPQRTRLTTRIVSGSEGVRRSVAVASSSSSLSSPPAVSDEDDSPHERVEIIRPSRTSTRTESLSRTTSSQSNPSNGVTLPRLELSANPSLRFYKMSWWEMLMNSYSEAPSEAIRLISSDLSGFFKYAHHALSFLHVPTFLSEVARPQSRERMQPSLVLSVLALSSTMLSRNSRPARMKHAMLLHSWAVAAFEASINAQWVNVQLAQAALLMTVFEATPHQDQSYERLNAAWKRIDVLFTALGLHQLDYGSPDVTVFERSGDSGTYLQSLRNLSTKEHAHSHEPSWLGQSHRSLNDFSRDGSTLDSEEFPHSPLTPSGESDHYSMVNWNRRFPNGHAAESDHLERHSRGWNHGSPSDAVSIFSAPSTNSGCACQRAALSAQVANASAELGLARLSPGILASSGWDEGWSKDEIQKEEARRAFWTAIALIASGQAHESYYLQARTHFLMGDIPQIAVYMPGEAYHASLGLNHLGKSSVWAMNSRTYLLWFSAVQLDDASSPELSPLPMAPEKKAPIAAQIWLESERLTHGLDDHQCGVEAAQLFPARYFLQFSRMLATKDFSQHVPSAHAGSLLPQRNEAEIWIAHLQEFVARASVPQALDDLMRNIACNPWMVWHFVDHVKRCLDLWRQDPTLIVALEVAAQMQPALWAIIEHSKPAPLLEGYGHDLANQLRDALQSCGQDLNAFESSRLQISWPTGP
ncbi:hypothetical protein DL93DRAFT_2162996 [Clavulina sp. PMI_390]|nr:hypothetical protein DL93DRAFT_2162996 [Clavulina sp. PMI_390]